MRPTVLAVSLTLCVSVVAAERELPREPRAGGSHVFLASHAPLSTSDRAELKAKGIDILQAAAGGRYIARVAYGVSDARIASLEPITAEDKVHPSLRRELGRG